MTFNYFFSAFFAAVLFAAAVMGHGFAFLKCIRQKFSFCEQIFLQYAAGCLLCSLAVYLSAWHGLYSIRITQAVSAVGLVFFLFFLKSNECREYYQKLRKTVLNREENIYLLLIGLCIAVIFLGSFAPVIAGDATRGHLAVPEEIIRDGNFPTGQFTCNYYLPLVYSLFVHQMALNIHSVQLFCLFSGIINILIAYSFFRMYMNRNYALMGTVFFVYMPIIYFQFTSCYLDLFVEIFGLGGVYFICKAGKEKFYKNIFISGILCGMSVASKINGMAVVITLIFFMIVKVFRNKHYALGIIVYLAAVIPVLFTFSLRNYAVMHNPFWPDMAGFFGGVPRIFEAEQMTGVLKDTAYWYKVAVFYWILSVCDTKLLNAIPPLYLITGIFGIVYFMKKNKEILIFTALFPFVAAFAKYFQLENRYYFTVAAPLMLLAAAGVKYARESSDKLIRYTCVAAASLTIVLNSGILLKTFSKEIKFFCGFISYDQYLNSSVDYYRFFKYINDNNKNNRQVFLIGIDEKFYLNAPCSYIYWTTVLNNYSEPEYTVTDFFSENNLEKNFKTNRYEYVLFRNTYSLQFGLFRDDDFQRTRKYLDENYSEIMQDSNYTLYCRNEK